MAAPPRPQIKLAGPRLYGDLTGDGIVNLRDLPLFFEVWLEGDCNESAELDMNGDCVVNLYEFSLLAENWLEETP